MGWERRGGGSYYYRKERRGRRVRSKYVGIGVFAQICAENDRDDRRERATIRNTERAMRQTQGEIDRQLAATEAVINALTNAVLYAAGYRKHKGQWRKRRHETKELDNH
jgi:hypothetical protein